MLSKSPLTYGPLKYWTSIQIVNKQDGVHFLPTTSKYGTQNVRNLNVPGIWMPLL